MNTATRLALVIGLAVLVHLGYLVMRSGGIPSEFRPLRRDLHELPMQLGVWQGKELPIDPELSGAVNADIVVDREYRNPTGHRIILHTNAVMRYFKMLKHHPRHCYTAHGARLLEEEEDARLEMPDGSSIPVGLMTMETDGQRILVMYWYQLGDQIILNGDQQRRARWKLRGQKTWPPLIKVLLQAPVLDAEQARERLMEFAQLVYKFTKEVDRQPDEESPAS